MKVYTRLIRSQMKNGLGEMEPVILVRQWSPEHPGHSASSACAMNLSWKEVLAFARNMRDLYKVRLLEEHNQ